MMKRSAILTLLLLDVLLTALSSQAQDPPGTEIYLVPLVSGDEAGSVTLGEPVNVTERPGYDNQPAFHPDGQRLFYTAIADGQADIWIYDLEKKTRERLAQTPESE